SASATRVSTDATHSQGILETQVTDDGVAVYFGDDVQDGVDGLFGASVFAEEASFQLSLPLAPSHSFPSSPFAIFLDGSKVAYVRNTGQLVGGTDERDLVTVDVATRAAVELPLPAETSFTSLNSVSFPSNAHAVWVADRPATDE